MPRTSEPAGGRASSVRLSGGLALACTVSLLLGLAVARPAVAIAPRAAASLCIELPDRALPAAVPPEATAALELGTPGRWQLEWDARSGTLAAGLRGRTPPGPPASTEGVVQRAEGFRDRHARLLGAAGTALRRVRAEHFGHAWHVTWQQLDAGRPVLDAYLDLAQSEAGEVIAFRSTLAPGAPAAPAQVGLETAVEACRAALGRPIRVAAREEVVVVVPDAASQRAVPALRLDLCGRADQRWDAVVDCESGSVLRLDSQVRFGRLVGSCSAAVQPLYAQDESADRPLRWLRLELAGDARTDVATSDSSAAFAFERADATGLQLGAELAGPYVAVSNDAGDPEPRFDARVDVPGSAQVHFGEAEARLDERTIYYHTIVVHDFVRARFDFRLLDYPMPAVAAVRDPGTGNPDYANAFWNGEGMYFGTGGGGRLNFGLFADVIYHEYVHGITDFMYRPLGGLPGHEGASIHEALSDYFACTITNEPLIGEGVGGDFLSAFRDLDNDLQWPEDRVGEEHGDGEILGGAFWELRTMVGAEIADPILHFARALAPRTFDAYASAALLEDDLLFGDAQAANGSPHRSAILAAFAAHGIGSGASATRRIVHVPLGDTETPGQPRQVRAGFEGRPPSAADTLRLYYSGGGPFVRTAMRRLPDGDFLGEIPASVLADGATIRYWLRLEGKSQHGPLLVDPPGAPQSTHVFHVGPDTQPPRIAHDPPDSVPAFAWPVSIVARIEDNLGVAHAWVECRRNGAPGAWLGMARSRTDPSRFVAQFPNVGGVGDVIEYSIFAVDAAQAANQIGLPDSGAVFRFVLVPELQDGFESGAAWEHAPMLQGGADAWHTSEAQNHTPAGRRAWLCGAAAGEYPPGMAAALVTDTYPLAAGARAHVWSRMDAEPNGDREAFDGGVVQIQVDGEADWSALVPEGGYTHRMADTGGTNALAPGTPCLSGRDADWHLLQFDLGGYARRSVRLRFLFASDGTASPFGLAGWALDDFGLDPGQRDPTGAALPPAPAARLLCAAPAPNPFNPRVTFAMQVPADAGQVRLQVHDARGRRVRTLLDGPLAPGALRLFWDGTGESGLALPSGVYYYRLVSRLGIERGQLVLVR